MGTERTPDVRYQTRLTDFYFSLYTACSFCRESKKKCSGTAPCTQCLRRGLPHECHITYLPRGFRSRNKHNASAGANRQSWSAGSRAPATSAQETGGATLPSPSNVSGSLPDTHMTATAGIIGPLSPSESRDDNDDNRSYQAGGSTVTATLGNYAASEDTSLTKPGPRMLLSSHGERGMSTQFPSFTTASDIFSSSQSTLEPLLR